MGRMKNKFIITDIKDKYNEKSNEKKVKKIKIKSKDDLNKCKNESKIVNKIERNDQKMKEEMNELNRNEDILDTNESMDEKIGNVSTINRFKSNRFLKKCFDKRRENGLILLSPKVEQKIYKLKKSLRNKGLPELEIKDIIRKRRRDEENKYNRYANQKCFKCRQMGHRLADCPLNTNDCEEGVDVCYRCGSSEHKLSECKQRSKGLPFAKCFLCSLSGHLTRDCTQNQRGIYPKGGSCKACHSVNHLIKDCPQNQKDEETENDLMLSTIEGNHSVDAEVMDSNPTQKYNTNKQKKFIKF